jgi:hypothetical protein
MKEEKQLNHYIMINIKYKKSFKKKLQKCKLFNNNTF